MLAMLLPAMANLTGKQGTCTYDLDSVSGVLTIRSSDDAPSWGGELKIDNPLFGSPFTGNKAIREVVIAEGVSEIGTGAFLDCSRIEKISFPSTCGVLGFTSGEYDEEGLEAIQAMPFMGCTGLRTIEMHQRYCPDLPNYHYFEEFNETTLGFDPKQVTLVVYDESVQTYKEHAKTWGRMNYATFPAVAGGTFGDGLTWKMSGNGKLTVSGSGAMPDLKALKDMPWAPYADQLTEVMICEGITHVGAYSFVYCSKIEKVYLPATLQSIGEQAFAYTSGLTEITCAASEAVPTLPANAFASFGDMKRYVYVYSFMTDAFKADAQWGNESNFRIVEFRAAMTVLPAAEITAETRGENAVYVSWPVVEGAEVIVITVLSGVNNEYQFVFDGKGHIAQYNRNAPRPEKKDSEVDGMEFVLPGLESDTEYEISVVAKDAEDKELVSYKAKVKTSAPKKDKQAPHDALAGRFSINSDGDVVAFSPGNLRYNAATQLWSFAPAQNAIVGADNANISDSYDGDIDLFGWGTSGYNGVMPYLTDDNDNIYAPIGKDITGTNYDWGLFNKAPWRTMTAAEWEYLLSTRENAAAKNGNATVDEVPGLVLLPDEWTLPEGLTFTAQPLDYTTNTYTAGQWAEMEAAGAVFLPAAARRQVKDIYNITSNRRGYYWTSSIAASDDRAQFVDFRPAKTVTLSNDYLSTGYSVRLAMDITRHTVTFVDYDGAELKTEVVEEGKSATAPEDPSRKGYTFTGWDKDYTNVTSDLTVTAQYEPVTSGICGQDGEGNLADNLTWSFDTETGVLTIEGTGAMKDFESEHDVPWGGFNLIEAIVLPDGLTTIGNYAFFGCDAPTSVVIPESVISIGNHAFSFCKGLTSVVIPEGVITIADFAFYECTALISATIPASTIAIGSSAFRSTSLKEITNHAVTPQELGNYVFYKVDQANCKLYVHTKSIDTYKAAEQWKEFEIIGLEEVHTVTFVDYDGTELKKESVIEGEAATAPEDPSREGYTFTGWDIAFDNVTSDLTVTAQYKIISCELVTVVDYGWLTVEDLDKGTSTLSSGTMHWHFDYGTNIRLSVEGNNGFEFSHWEDDNTDNPRTLVISGDTEMRAYCTLKTFTVTFVDWDGTVLATRTVEYGGAAPLPDEPARDGYIFLGWDKSNKNVTEDLTITAEYIIRTYTVTFLDFYGNPIGEPQTIEHGASAMAPEAPEVTGYHFVEWDSNYNEIYSDMTVKAVYEKNEYTVKFLDWDGSELSSQVVKFEEAAIAPEDPTREGYTFKGWDKAFDVITEDLTVTAQYVQNDPTGILSPTLRKEGEKVLRDGVLYILRDGKTYNANGALVK